MPSIAPEIIFHDVDRSEWIETYIVERLQKLERFAQGITRCRVTLSQEQGKHKKGNRYSVMVEVRMPPQHDLAIKKQKEIRDMPTQLPALINLAFGAIERQLKKTAALRRGEEKAHDRNSVLHGDFERLSVGTAVRFSPEDGDNGPQASSVQVIGKSASI
jgi:ribosomal subunit interface protein